MQCSALEAEQSSSLARQVQKIRVVNSEDAGHPTIQGLRHWNPARVEAGYSVDQIAGMSRQNVEHYMRFKDQMKVAADGQRRLRIVYQ
ncbi:hypothetical protein JQ543_06740 [Bradyrhizobium diazoefficiens]|nr:hypothetical protein [Bradyrhizobium diazoefficiens]MBR0847431.1 hypothetical protein [Bradyrhizobium diazoefficiens]